MARTRLGADVPRRVSTAVELATVADDGVGHHRCGHPGRCLPSISGAFLTESCEMRAACLDGPRGQLELRNAVVCLIYERAITPKDGRTWS